MDVVEELGVMAFASRLERLSSRLRAGITMLYHQRGVDFNDNWFLVGYMLSKHGCMTVTELANALGISTHVIKRISVEMAGRKLITIKTDENDCRRRCFVLTDKGEDAVAALEPVWKAVGDCTAELIASTGNDVLKELSDIEKELEERGIFVRVVERLSDKH